MTKTIKIGGIIFKRAEVFWEDSTTVIQEPPILENNGVICENATCGYVAKIGNRLLVIHDRSTKLPNVTKIKDDENVDCTYITLKPKVIIKYV